MASNENFNSNDLAPDEQGIFVQDGAIFCYGQNEREWLMMEPVPETSLEEKR